MQLNRQDYTLDAIGDRICRATGYQLGQAPYQGAATGLVTHTEQVVGFSYGAVAIGYDVCMNGMTVNKVTFSRHLYAVNCAAPVGHYDIALKRAAGKGIVCSTVYRITDESYQKPVDQQALEHLKAAFKDQEFAGPILASCLQKMRTGEHAFSAVCYPESKEWWLTNNDIAVGSHEFIMDIMTSCQQKLYLDKAEETQKTLLIVQNDKDELRLVPVF